MTRSVKRGGKIWIPRLPGQAGYQEAGPKPEWAPARAPPTTGVAVVKPGRILFEMAGVDQVEAVEAMRLASHKLPVATRVVLKEGLADGH